MIVDIADNAYTREMGLMFVEDLPQDRGMLFIFPQSHRMSFWGKNTLIPLDIAFIDDNRKIASIEQIDKLSLKAVVSNKPCKMALEANLGYFEENGIKVGDSIEIDDSIEFKLSEISHFQRNSRGLRSSSQSYKPQARIVFHKIEKEPGDIVKNIKESQAALPENKVDKANEKPIGDPIVQEVDGKNLPVLDIGDVSEILEDSFDEGPQEVPGALPEEEAQEVRETQEVVPEDAPVEVPKQYPVFNTAFEATEWAEKNNEVVRISYTTKHGRQLVRDVEPHGKFHSKSTMRSIVVTYDETVGGIRAFIATNIGKWAFVGKKFDKKFVVRA